MKLRFRVNTLLKCLALLILVLPCLAPTPCNLGISEYPGSSQKEGRQGTSDVYGVDHELYQPFDEDTGMPSGIRKHGALTVLKTIDKATPGLNKALATGQNLRAVVLDWYRIDPASRQEMKYYTITLRQARVVGAKVIMPTSFDPAYESYQHMEEIRFVYEQIEWHWLPDDIIESDNWRAPGGSSTDKSTSLTPVEPQIEPSRKSPVKQD